MISAKEARSLTLETQRLARELRYSETCTAIDRSIRYAITQNQTSCEALVGEDILDRVIAELEANGFAVRIVLRGKRIHITW